MPSIYETFKNEIDYHANKVALDFAYEMVKYGILLTNESHATLITEVAGALTKAKNNFHPISPSLSL